jgi:integrase
MPPRRRRGGWRTHKGRIEAYIRLGDKLHTHQFPKGTDAKTLQGWIDREFYDHQRKHPRGEAGTLARDVETYLPLLADRPDLQRDRTLHLAWWCETFGRRARWSLEAHELKAALASLTAEGYAASTVKKYRTALFHLFTSLDGHNAPNPLRDVTPPREPDPLPRALPPAIVDAIFAAMLDRGQGERFKTRPTVSKTKARLQVMAYVGLPPAQVKQITAADIDWTDPSLLVRGRAKGQGTRTVRLPLTEQGVLALRAFVAAEAFGRFSTSSARKVFLGAITRMCATLEAKPETAEQGKRLRTELAAFGPRPYDLRHGFLSRTYAISHDIYATQLLGLHTDPRMTARYTLAAVDPRLKDVIGLLNQSRRTTDEHPPEPAETRRIAKDRETGMTPRKPAKIRTKRRKIV